MTRQHLSDNKIIEGFRRGDSDIIQEYFYGYCRIGYFIYDQKYQLSEKENLDFSTNTTWRLFLNFAEYVRSNNR